MTGNGDCMFGSRDLVRVGEGVIFEVYMGDEKLLKGTYRRGEYSRALEALRMERSHAFRDVAGWIKEAEVYVTAEAGGREVTMREKVEATMKSHASYKGFKPLAVVPEDREMDDTQSDVARLCFCTSEQPESGFDVHGDDNLSKEIETEIERLGWAVNFGIWVICLGAGYLVSRASSWRLRHKRVI